MDISRTVRRAHLPALTGIDRVERAYLRWVKRARGRFLVTLGARDYLLGADAAGKLVDWLDGVGAGSQRSRRQATALARQLGVPLAWDALAGWTYLNVGHESLTTRLVDGARAAGLRSVAMVHDTIPLDHPEFAGRGSPARFRSMLRAAGATDLILTNSRATARCLGHYLDHPRVNVVPLGIDPPISVPARPRRSFLCIGTIEPRKNHAMLLDIWHRLGPAAPPLRIIGRRGWAGSELLWRLDTDPSIGRTVHELGPVDDPRLAVEIASATALVFPSRAEGYGLPLGQALAAGLPVIASDLPALRELGGDVPEWLPPDPTLWRDTIMAFARQPSPHRAAQLRRLADWRRPSWAAHFTIVERAIAEAIG